MIKKVIPIVTQSERVKVRTFLEIIYKFHKLTDKEMDIVTEFVIQYYRISITFKDTTEASIELINKLLFDTDSRKIMYESLNVKEDVFNNYLTKLRKKGVIKDGKLNAGYIPPQGEFEFTFKFK